LHRFNKLYVAAPRNEDINTLIHQAGSVSIKKGGGEFEFTISPGPSKDLDEENIVFGKVLSFLLISAHMAVFPSLLLSQNACVRLPVLIFKDACHVMAVSLFSASVLFWRIIRMLMNH
jgi:hypothetical protein